APARTAGPPGPGPRWSAASSGKRSRPGRAEGSRRGRSARWPAVAEGVAARSARASDHDRVEPRRGPPEGNLQATSDRKNVVRRTGTTQLLKFQQFEGFRAAFPTAGE